MKAFANPGRMRWRSGAGTKGAALGCAITSRAARISSPLRLTRSGGLSSGAEGAARDGLPRPCPAPCWLEKCFWGMAKERMNKTH